MPKPGTALKRTGIALIVLGGLIYFVGGGSEGDNPLAFFGPVVMLAGLLLHFRGRRIAAKARSDSEAAKDRKSTRLNSSHRSLSRMPSSA